MNAPQTPSDFTTPYFAHDVHGVPITRERTCLCGRHYTQALLSERVLLAVERRGKACMAEFARQIPEFYVPVECPTCERHQLRLEADRATIRATPDREVAA